MALLKPQVLPGTMLGLVLKVCEKHGIEVVREMPNVNEASQWDAAFVSSMSIAEVS